MNDIAQQFYDEISEIASLLGKLQDRLRGVPVSKKLREAIERFHVHYQQYGRVLESGDADALLQAVTTVGLYARVTAQRLAQVQGLDQESVAIGQALGRLGDAVKRKIDHDTSTFRPLGELPSIRPVPSVGLSAAAMQRLEQFISEHEKQDERVKNRLADNDRRLAAFAESLTKLEADVQATLSRVKQEEQNTLSELEAKRVQIDSILGHASGRVIAGDFEGSAASEKTAADWLRVGSLLCMAAIVAMLGFSFWETVKEDFDWHKSLFRVVLAFLISAPAAYLARESTKHRAQQYHHLQTALDLKAIAPYLASLPEDVQHRIKSEVAGKLFAGRDLSHVTSESYPINAQEVLMELVRKVGATAAEKSDKPARKEQS